MGDITPSSGASAEKLSGLVERGETGPSPVVRLLELLLLEVLEAEVPNELNVDVDVSLLDFCACWGTANSPLGGGCNSSGALELVVVLRV